MYLQALRVINDGPLADVSIEVHNRDGRPLPLLIVGENGAGKSNLLSLIADALIEGAAQHHTDILSGGSGLSRPWFRVVGGTTVRRGADGGFALLKFEDEGNTYFYKEKAGTFPIESLPDNLSEDFRQAAAWPETGSVKEFSIDETVSRKLYRSGCYVFFPASRSEAPHWLNGESLPDATFATPSRFDGRLGHSMFVERGLEPLGRWISSVLIDARPELAVEAGGIIPQEQHRVANLNYQAHLSTQNLINRMLQIILDDPNARFAWTNRTVGLSFISPRANVALPLSALSSGQATLLAVFGTILMQCDLATNGQPSQSPGLCLIDEVDAHVHIDLAFRAIPELIALLPKVQFITSAHSPLYILGMQNFFGDDGFQLINLPEGRSISAEGFSEFRHALEVLRETRTFDEDVAQRVAEANRPLILCEGETDPRYLAAAAKILGREDVIAGLTVDWIGKQNKERGGSIGAGKDNLDRAWKLLTTNPELVARKTLLLFDNDVKKPDADEGDVSIRVLPSNEDNTEVKDGIENLLDPRVFTSDMFTETVSNKGNGTTVTTTSLRKMALCDYLCTGELKRENFEAFTKALDLIERWKAGFNAPLPDQASDPELAVED